MSSEDFAYESDLRSAYRAARNVKQEGRGRGNTKRDESSCRSDRRRIVIVEVVADKVLENGRALLFDEVLKKRGRLERGGGKNGETNRGLEEVVEGDGPDDRRAARLLRKGWGSVASEQDYACETYSHVPENKGGLGRGGRGGRGMVGGAARYLVSANDVLNSSEKILVFGVEL